MVPYKIDLSKIEWQSPMAGIRHKYVDYCGQRIRLVEYTGKLPPHWCEKGHCGYLLSGRMAIKFIDGEITYNEGDAIFIPDGPEHMHKGRVLSEKAMVFFIERE
ncbi:MAG: cupin domain-containing protein [Desulfobacterales bacterium]|nr:cupin domain-containing protein [Desulfobacterales bacterium]